MNVKHDPKINNIMKALTGQFKFNSRCYLQCDSKLTSHCCLPLINVLVEINYFKIIQISESSVKWSILAHLKSQPRGQNFQAQI